MSYPRSVTTANTPRGRMVTSLASTACVLLLAGLLGACASKSAGSRAGESRSDKSAASSTSDEAGTVGRSSSTGAGGAGDAGRGGTSAAGGGARTAGGAGAGGAGGAAGGGTKSGGVGPGGTTRRGGVGGASDVAVNEDGSMSLYGDEAEGDDEFVESDDAAGGAGGGRRSATGRKRNAGAASSAGDTGAAGGQGAGGAAGQGASAQGGAGGRSGTGAQAGGGAGDGVAGATGSRAAGGAGGGAGVGAGGATGASTAGAGGSTAGGAQQEEMIVGMVDAPGSRVRIEEEVTPQTLGGMLPMSIGVDEEGQFDFDQAVLRPEVKQVLDELVERLRDAEWDRLDLIGYTDRIGTSDYNQQLSERRAWAVARYLIDQGVPLNKIKIEGRGEGESLVGEDECTSVAREELIACLQKDRRVAIEASIRKTQANVH